VHWRGQHRATVSHRRVRCQRRPTSPRCSPCGQRWPPCNDPVKTCTGSTLVCPLCGRCLHAGSARQTGKRADCRPLFIPPQPGVARDTGQNGTPQAPPNSPLANGSGLKQIGVLRDPGAHHFDRLALTGWGALLTPSCLKAKHIRLTDWHYRLRGLFLPISQIRCISAGFE